MFRRQHINKTSKIILNTSNIHCFVKSEFEIGLFKYLDIQIFKNEFKNVITNHFILDYVT